MRDRELLQPTRRSASGVLYLLPAATIIALKQVSLRGTDFNGKDLKDDKKCFIRRQGGCAEDSLSLRSHSQTKASGVAAAISKDIKRYQAGGTSSS